MKNTKEFEYIKVIGKHKYTVKFRNIWLYNDGMKSPYILIQRLIEQLSALVEKIIC